VTSAPPCWPGRRAAAARLRDHQEIAERTGGAWRPSPGSVYPTLSQLEDEGLVRVEQSEGRAVVHLTEAGTTYVTSTARAGRRLGVGR
jgi:DNA-binding PadR family transcriptional regulator